MKQNKISVIIKRSIEEVFEFTTNPKNTPLWVPSIVEEIAEEYPPKINTVYKNRGKDSVWNFYKVLEFEANKTFALTNLDETFVVKYTYKKLGENQTELVYVEQVKKGELNNPFTRAILLKLKSIMEKND